MSHKRLTIGALAGWQAYSGTMDSFISHVFRGIQAAANDLDLNLLIGCGLGQPYGVGYGRPAWPITLPEVDFIPIGPWNTDGLLIVPPLATLAGQDYFRGLIDARFPFVYAGDRDSGPAVVVDNTGGIKKAVAHLRQHGHTRIAFVSGRDPSVEGDGRIRLRAYQAAVQEFSLPLDPDLVVQGYHTYIGGKQSVEKLLADKVDFTALIASNDECALGAMDALLDAGLAIPDDVAVIGFDDRLEGRAHVPPLTSVHFPMFEMGYQSVKLLHRFILEGSNPREILTIPTYLVLRDSCGCTMGEIGNLGLAQHSADEPVIEVQSSLENDVQLIHAQSTVLTMAAEVFNESSRMGLQEITTHCENLVEAFLVVLSQARPEYFFMELAQVLDRATQLGDNQLYAWQVAISVLRRAYPPFLESPFVRFSATEIEDIFNQARMQINVAARGNISRLRLRFASNTDQIGQMIARFFSAQDEAEIYQILNDSLPAIGIKHAAIAFYKDDEEDVLSSSILQAPLTYAGQKIFPTRQFPPEGLYDPDQPFSLVLLPIKSETHLDGYLAFEGGNLEMCAVILNQLQAALQGVHLYRQAVNGRQLAEEANRLKGHFLSVVSHELRTPLNLISGLSDMLLRRSLPSDRECTVPREDLERIYISAQHLDGLIRDVLDLGQSDIGQLRLTMETMDITEVLKGVAIVGESLAREKGLVFRVEISDRLSRVRGDRTRLRQVVLNLVNNAIKFTSKGEILLTAVNEVGQVRVSVSDTGLGIQPNEQQVIFDEFRQSERTTARGYGGLGLGLAICKRLVEQHGGEIGVCSSGEEGEGSNFFFTLPALPAQQSEEEHIKPANLGKQVMLLVKDLAGADNLKASLEQKGVSVDVRQVEYGSDWMAWLVPGIPQAVVLDLELTSERGWEIIKALKENSTTQNIPVFFFAIKQETNTGAMFKLDYLTKPLESSTLVESLTALGIHVQGIDKEDARSILVVDDDPGTVELHTRQIESQFPGYRMFNAGNGAEALEIIRKERPALVILDLMMPGMDGFAVLEAMRAEELIRNVPVIVVTGQDLTADDMERLSQGVTGILSKGMFTVQETLEQVASALEHRRRAGSEVQRIVYKAVAYIHAHYSEGVTRQDVSKFVGLSERHLTRCFHQVLGLAPMVYLNRYRVQQAKKLLEEGSKGITEIALAVGFSTSSYFTRVFRDEVGISPRAYMRSKCGPIAE